MSLKKAIRDLIPFEWEVVLKSKKKLNLFVDYVYVCLPEYMKGKYGYKDGLLRINYMYKHYPIYKCFDPNLISFIDGRTTREILKEWQDIETLIQTYKFNCN